MVQLAKQSLLTPEVHGSNPVIGEIYIEHCVMSTELKRLKYKKKRPGMVHFKKQYYERTLEREAIKSTKHFSSKPRNRNSLRAFLNGSFRALIL